MALLDVLSLRVFEYFTRSEPRVKPATHEGIQEASEEYVTAVPRKHSPGVTDAVGALPTSKKQDSATAPVVHEHESNSIKKTDNAVEDTSSTEVWAKFEEIVPSELKDLIVLDASPDTTSTGSLANTRRKHGFTLKLVTLDEGLYKGRQVLVIEKVKPFPFLKLSSEIRNQIYEDVLGGLGAQIRIVSRESCNPVRPDISTDACGGWEEKWEGQPSPVVISRVCKQIWTETAPMVYNRRFHFPEVQYAKIFFDCIGSMREHLRDVTIEDTASFEVWNARPILLMLQDARALQGLRFSGHLGRTLDPLDVAKDPTRIARAVSPLVKRVGQPLTASTQRKLSWMLSRLR